MVGGLVRKGPGTESGSVTAAVPMDMLERLQDNSRQTIRRNTKARLPVMRG